MLGRQEGGWEGKTGGKGEEEREGEREVFVQQWGRFPCQLVSSPFLQEHKSLLTGQ